MMHQIRIFSKTKTIVGFQLLQPVNSSGFEALVFSYAYPYIRHSRNLPVVEHTYPHVSTPALNHRERVVGVVTIWRYSVVSTPDHFIPNTPGEWSTGANKQQTTDHLDLPTCRTTRGQSDISAHYLRLYNIFCPFLFSDLHSTPYRLAGPSCTRPWQISGTSEIDDAKSQAVAIADSLGTSWKYVSVHKLASCLSPL